MNVEVIRIIRYVGSEEAVSKAIALSLPEGIRYCGDYEIQVATHSSNLPPAVKLEAEDVTNTLAGRQTERKLPSITDIHIEYKGPAFGVMDGPLVGGKDK